MIEVRRSASPAEDARSNEIYNAVCPRDAYANEDTQAFKAAMVAADDYLAFADGAAVGSAYAAIRPERRELVFAVITVLESHRRRGAGTALYEAVSAWSAERGLDKLEVFVDEDDAAAIAFAEKRGFRRAKRYGRMALTLASITPPEIDPPAGIEIRIGAKTEALLRGVYEVEVEAGPDEPGSEDEVAVAFEEWLPWELQGSERGAELTFVALAEEQVVGYAKLSFTQARPGSAGHRFTAVARSWRGRGVAGALKRAQIVWAKAAGYEQLTAQNEERNTPIRILNERLGYKPVPGRFVFHGPLSAGA
jgi:GNAT superfamily N-acetyltransferase